MMAHKNGELDKYAQKYKEIQSKSEDVECTICENGSGWRKPPLLDLEGNSTDGNTLQKCNGCNGTGKRDNWAKSYPFSVDNAVEFAKFAKESGGFQIC